MARGKYIDPKYPWDKVAVKLTMEHPSQTLLFMNNDGISPTNPIGAFRWNALGSPEFEKMMFETLREFGVSVYAQMEGPKNGGYAPSFHIIDHIIYHTSLDTPDLVPATRPRTQHPRICRGVGSSEQDDHGAAAWAELQAARRGRRIPGPWPRSASTAVGSSVNRHRISRRGAQSSPRNL